MVDNTANIIEVNNVYKSFDDDLILNNINFSIKKGEFITLLGPSGCGKTTLLRIIAGFLKESSGSITLMGRNLLEIPSHLRPINTVFQNYALFPHLNVYDNIAFGLKLKKIKPEVIEKEVKNALKMVAMSGYEERTIDSLSGGQQQRVAIARAMINKPQVLLLDEPLSALDLKMRKEMQLELKEMHKNFGITFIYVTHDQEEALTLSDRILVLNRGVIQQLDTPTNIYNEPANIFVANFVGDSNIVDAVISRKGFVSFASNEFECQYGNFNEGTYVDVVVRPEDIVIKYADENSKLQGRVTDVIFKGVHYDILVETADSFEFHVHNYKEFFVGDNVELILKPEEIHLIKKNKLTNRFSAKVLEGNKIEIYDTAIKLEDDIKYNVGDEIEIEVNFKNIDLRDNEEEGIIPGTVSDIIYKCNHYNILVEMDDNRLIYVDTQDIWDKGDRVGVSFLAKDIKIV